MIKGKLLFVVMLMFLQGFPAGDHRASRSSDNRSYTHAADFPVPPQNDHSLFYVQRSKNTNSIVYETNTLPDGSLNPESPVRIYWIRYATDSTTDELTYIQRKYAYGLEASAVKGHPGQYVLNFVSYSRKKIYLVRDASSPRYHAYTSINGKLAELKRIFLSLDGGTFWFPKITDIEISGKDPLSQKPVEEHFTP